jgi:hypothetical protein
LPACRGTTGAAGGRRTSRWPPGTGPRPPLPPRRPAAAAAPGTSPPRRRCCRAPCTAPPPPGRHTTRRRAALQTCMGGCGCGGLLSPLSPGRAAGSTALSCGLVRRLLQARRRGAHPLYMQAARSRRGSWEHHLRRQLPPPVLSCSMHHRGEAQGPRLGQAAARAAACHCCCKVQRRLGCTTSQPASKQASKPARPHLMHHQRALQVPAVPQPHVVIIAAGHQQVLLQRVPRHDAHARAVGAPAVAGHAIQSTSGAAAKSRWKERAAGRHRAAKPPGGVAAADLFTKTGVPSGARVSHPLNDASSAPE